MVYPLGAVENLVSPPHPSLNNSVMGQCRGTSSCTFLKPLCCARKDYYDILKVPKGAADSVIKRSYRKLALQYHPVPPAWWHPSTSTRTVPADFCSIPYAYVFTTCSLTQDKVKGSDEEKADAAKKFVDINHGAAPHPAFNKSNCWPACRAYCAASWKQVSYILARRPRKYCLYSAYEVLSNEEKRRIYDRYGEDGLKQHDAQGGGGGGGAADIFSQCPPHSWGQQGQCSWGSHRLSNCLRSPPSFACALQTVST